MNKQEVIKTLEKKRETALENIEYYHENEKYETMNRVRVDSYTIAIQAIEKMEEADKVEVTEEQAELLRAFRDESLYELLANCLREDEELMVKAHLYGYTVKPKRWVVKHKEGKFFEKFTGNGTSRAWVVWKNQAYIFTDKSKAEAVATLVEGSVEEID